MSNFIDVSKDVTAQCAIPTVWRHVFEKIVDGLKVGDFDKVRAVKGVRPVSEETLVGIIDNIEGYGAHLTSLPAETWGTSVCQWMDGYWEVLVDLYTEEEGASDLALSARVYEELDGYAFDILSVHVP